MPPELAAVTHVTLCGRGGSQQSVVRKLRRELGSSSFQMLRQDVNSARTMLMASVCGLAPSSVGHSQVRSILSMWYERLAAAISATSHEGPKRAASLLGQLLAGIPELEAREGFKHVLAEWADSHLESVAQQPADDCAKSQLTSSDKMLEELTFSLLFSEDLTAKERDHQGRRVLSLMQRRQEGVPTRIEVEAVATVAEAVPELVPEAVLHFEGQVLRLGEATRLDKGAWLIVANAPPQLRLVLLDVLIGTGGIAALEDCGIDADAALKACADLAVEEATRSEAMRNRGESLERASRVLRLVAAGARFGGAFGGDANVGSASRGLAVARVFGDVMGDAAPLLLKPLLLDVRERSDEYTEEEIFSVVDALSKAGAGSRSWSALASALVGRWGTAQPELLLQSMRRAPAKLASTPVAFQRAVAEECERTPGILTGVRPRGFLRLLDWWAAGSSASGALAPQALRQLLRATMDVFLHELDAKRLVKASIMLNDDRSSAEADIMLLWFQWFQDMVAACRPGTGWGRAFEALREVTRWRDLESTAKREPTIMSLGEAILQGVVAEQLCAAERAPMDLLMELSRALSGAELPVSARLAYLLETRVRQSLRGAETLPLMLAVQVGSGETPVRCSPEVPFWDALVLSITSKLRTLRDVDLFCRSRPSQQLLRAVIQQAEGWQALELHSRARA